MKVTIPQTYYLAQAFTLAELNRPYRELARKFHPDRDGNLGTMQELNIELDYQRAELSRPLNHTRQQPCCRPRAKNSPPTIVLKSAAQHAYKKVMTNCYGVQLKIEAGTLIVFGSETFNHKEKLKSYGFCLELTGKYWHFVRAPKKAGVA